MLTRDIKRLAFNLLNGNPLLDAEKAALSRCISQKLSWYVSFPVGSYKKKLNDVRKNILKVKGDIAKAQLLIQKIASLSLTPHSLRALAKLLLIYDEALQPVFVQARVEERLNSLEENSADRLYTFIHAYNRSCLASRRLAGNLAFTVEDYRVFFTREGTLGAVLLDKKWTVPIAISKEEQNWNGQQLDEIAEVFFQIYCAAPYNSLSPMLEFMKYFREFKAENPALTLHQAYLAFDPDPVDMFNKYNSGDCVTVSAKIQAALKQRGFPSAVLGTPTRNMCTSPPIPKSSHFGVWKEYKRATESIFHCQVVAVFSDSQGDKGVAYMNPTFAYQEPLMRRKDFSLFPFNKKVQHLRTDKFEGIINLGHILKKQMSGKTSMQLLGPDFNGLEPIFGVDFLRGNIYVNRAGMKGLQGLPLNVDGYFSIQLEELRNNVARLYFIDGQEQSLAARDALELFSAIAKERFQLPDDFAENIVTLAENERGIIKKILLAPAQTAKETYHETKSALEIVREVNIQQNEYALIREKGRENYLMRCYRLKYQQLLFEFDELQDAIIANVPDEVRSTALEIARIKKQADELKEMITIQMAKTSKGKESCEHSETSEDSVTLYEFEDSALSDDEGSLSI